MPDNFVYRKIKGKLFHVTSLTNFREILKSGAIIANKSDSFSFSQSKISYAVKNGYVCIFDFKSCSDILIKEMAQTWVRILYTHEQTVLIVLDSRKLKNNVIPNKTLLREYRKNLSIIKDNYFIPHVEAWVKDRIPVEYISKAFLVNHSMQVCDEIYSSVKNIQL